MGLRDMTGYIPLLRTWGILCLLILMIFPAVAAETNLADTPWPKFHQNLNNTGLSPYVGSQTNTTKWTPYTTAYNFIYAGPTMGSDGTVYFGTRTSFFGMDPNGTIKWTYSIGSSKYIRSTPAVASDGTIYFGSYYTSNNFFAVSPNGSQKWVISASGRITSSPSIGSDGTIYFGSTGNMFYAVYPTGTTKWTFAPSDNPYYSYSSPAIGSDSIYIGSWNSSGSGNSKIYAINLTDGSERWNYTTGGVIDSSPAIGTDGRIYIGSSDTKVYAFDPEGTLNWTFTTSGEVHSSPAIGTDGTVYVGSNDYKVYAINSDGSERWNYTTGGAVRSSPAIGADGTVYVGSDDYKIYAINTDGSTKWFYTTGSTISGSPIIGPDGTVYVGSGDKKLYAFSGVVDFTADKQSGGTPLAVQFTGTSPLTVTQWQWDFGDGSTENATLQNPVHTYATPGSYTVNLTITHSLGTNTVSNTAFINIYSTPVANFTASNTSGKSPLTVAFTDTSMNSPTSWNWSFGDGTYSTSQNPTHSYSTSGTSATSYTVSLNATNLVGSNITTRADYITLYSTSPIVSFTGSPRTGGTYPVTVQFNDTSTLNPTNWSWDFGDGNTSTLKNPTHTYSWLGNFTVSLTATNTIGANTSSKTGFITVLKPAPLSTYNDMNLYVSNPEGVKYDVSEGVSDGTYVYIPNTYFFHQVGGFNAPHISTDSSTDNRYGQFTTTTNQSGTFWFTNTGGSGYFDNGILMIAVNGTIPDDFSVHIRSSGYNWTPATPQTNNVAPSSSAVNYESGALNQTFTKEDFYYGPQTWRPASSQYPIYYGQNTSDTSNTFMIMFIDLRAGVLQSGTDNGYMKIEYSFNNLTTFAAMNVYVWQSASNHGTGMMMTNGFSSSDTGPSSFAVIGIPAAPVAGFSTSASSGWFTLAPIQFNDTSTNVSQSRLWDFGDGSTSTDKNPTHTYTSAGSYSVNLTVTNVKGSSSTTKTVTITVPSVPVVSFYANSTSGTSPLPIQFVDTSTNSPISWYWNFGDGMNSTNQSPVHWFAPGTYSVNLTATNGGGSTSLVKTAYIKVSSNGRSNQFINPGFEYGDLTGWTAGPTYSTVSSNKPHNGTYSLYFDYSGGTSYNYVSQNIDLTNLSSLSYWGYEDGSMAYPQYFYTYIDGVKVQTDTLAHNWTQYTVPTTGYSGVHLVQITFDRNGYAMNSYVDDFVAGSDSGSSTTPPSASFTATPVNGAAPVSVQFTDTSTGSPASWTWDFGDGSTSTVKNPSHTYSAAGTYDVSMTATNSGGSSTKTRSSFIYVTDATGALSGNSNIYIRMANHDGIKYDSYSNGTYYMQSGSGGLNVIHISTDATVPAGQVTVTHNQSGTIYATSTGTYADDVILMLAVNGTVPDDFAATITSSGYTWTPSGSTPSSITYQSSALSQTFTKKDLFYGPQSWKPTQGTADYPLIYGENVSDSANQFQVMFIDLKAGIPGTSYSGYSSLTNQGAVKIAYSFTDLPDNAAFNFYGWKSGTGMGWTNQLVGSSGNSGYSVISSSIPLIPVAGFTASPTDGYTPVEVSFTDTSTNTPTSWYWDFGDGNTSAVKSPTHTYSSTGTFTVTHTVSNRGGSNTTTSTISVLAPKVETSSFMMTGVTTTTVGSAQNVSVDNANTTLVSGNTYSVANAGTNWDNLEITFTDIPTTNTSGGTTTLEGTVSNVQSAITPITTTLSSLGNPQVNISLNMGEVPSSGSSITTTVTSSPDETTGSAFTLAATNASKSIADIAYTITIAKTGIDNCCDGGIIRNATITMTVSPTWVSTNGGTSAVVIMHRSDNGTTTILSTTYDGTDASGNYVFTALSPTGLSTFGLAAVSSTTSSGSVSTSVSGGGSVLSETGRASVLSTTMSSTKPGDTATVSFTQKLTADMPIGVSSVAVTPAKTIDSTEVIVQDAISSQVQKITGRTVAGIESIELVNTNPSSIDHAVITFAVDGTWMKSYSLTPSDIVMLRNHDGVWAELPTQFDHQDGTTYYFTATTPGFSYFAVASRITSAATATATSTPVVTVTPGKTVTAAAPTQAVPTSTAKVAAAQPTTVPTQKSGTSTTTSSITKTLTSKTAIFGIIAGIVIIIVAVAFHRRQKFRSQDPLRPRR